MTRELHGTPAAPGIATGAPWIHRRAPAEGRASVPLADAAASAADELGALAGRLRDAGSSDEAEILDAQALMAGDPEMLDAAAALIADGRDPVAAIGAVGEQIAAVFAGLDDETLAARAADVRDVAGRIARHLVGAEAPRLTTMSIVVADDLPPSVTVELDRGLLAGIALESGSRTSHAAILARSLGIPAVVGVGGIVERAASTAEMALDGAAGLVLLDPDDDQREQLLRAASAQAAAIEQDLAYAGRPLQTADGHRVLCAANIGEPGEAPAAFDAGAEGIGLFRTEFAFAGRRTSPSVEDQAVAYARVLAAAGERPVVFRLADIGGDKPLPYVTISEEANPFLGVRAIRLVAEHAPLYADQLRAILRASADTGRRASIMAPMVADEADVALLRDLVDAACRENDAAPLPRVGIMVEVPSAVLLADRLARHVEFMSIGTNDLTQYLLAADRTNPALADRQDPLHPAVLRAIRDVVAGARGAGSCEVAVCGEMAGDPVGAKLLTGLGVDELSMGPAAFNGVKRALAGQTRAELQALAARALELGSAAEVRAMAAGA